MIRQLIEWAHAVAAGDPLGFAAGIGLSCFLFGLAIGRIAGWNQRENEIHRPQEYHD